MNKWMKRLLFYHKDRARTGTEHMNYRIWARLLQIKLKIISPWFNSLPQIGSTCTKGPSFCCSCNKSSRYWLRRRNPIQSNRINTEKGKRFRPRYKNTKNRGTGYSKKATIFQQSNRGAILPGMFWWWRGPHNRHRGHRPGRGEAFVRGHQRLHGGGLDWGRIKLLPVKRDDGDGRREDVIAFSWDFCRVLSPFLLCGKISRGGFQRNRAYEMSKTGTSSGCFFGWLASFLPSS
jgi:hypothetical protein